MTRQEWAFQEAELRALEDKRFPVEPHIWDDARRPAFAEMKRERARRRKAMGYSRATANSLVEWARKAMA